MNQRRRRVIILSLLSVLITLLALLPADGIPYFDAAALARNVMQEIDGIVESAHPTRCHDNFRVDGELFAILEEELRQYVIETPKLPLRLQIAIYLDWVGHAKTLHEQRERFVLSKDTVLTARNNVLDAIVGNMLQKYVTSPTTIPTIADPKFRAFEGCIGCIDGCHFKIVVPTMEKAKWRDHYQEISTNGMLACDLDNLKFIFCSFGAEGCGSDSAVLRNCIGQLPFPLRSFLLGDAGFSLSKFVLTPYRGIRYHLKEFAADAGGRPLNKEELFNLRHASFRNRIERCFGIIKKRFKILSNPLDLSTKDRQWKVMYSCAALHNFIRDKKRSLDIPILREVLEEEEEEQRANRANELDYYERYDEDTPSEVVQQWRDDIAATMWQEYRDYRNNR